MNLLDVALGSFAVLEVLRATTRIAACACDHQILFPKAVRPTEGAFAVEMLNGRLIVRTTGDTSVRPHGSCAVGANLEAASKT